MFTRLFLKLRPRNRGELLKWREGDFDEWGTSLKFFGQGAWGGERGVWQVRRSALTAPPASPGSWLQQPSLWAALPSGTFFHGGLRFGCSPTELGLSAEHMVLKTTVGASQIASFQSLLCKTLEPLLLHQKFSGAPVHPLSPSLELCCLSDGSCQGHLPHLHQKTSSPPLHSFLGAVRGGKASGVGMLGEHLLSTQRCLPGFPWLCWRNSFSKLWGRSGQSLSWPWSPGPTACLGLPGIVEMQQVGLWGSLPSHP